MKTTHYLTLILLCCICSFTAQAQNDTNTIQIQISNIKSSEGTISIGLYNSEESFYKKTFKSKKVKSEKGELIVTLENIPKGTYAISLFHDENDNNKLDTNLFKIPKEPYGTSNNAKGRFGPPSWEDAKFSVSDTEVIQSIKL
ncbi:DUF2141 domain-containing protein [Aquimarina litoralis]|uniref:DUF2141 domain-containing protein n=1 Tax=Aquimarina litoralis TaxID=584605 RepID=UPI001C563C65|nr:DUF2141 domain-containing protein [Aquimarina litoralis]MBW1295935.1 DUF2141 domain-containing protein [Aquimarina litoralis]